MRHLTVYKRFFKQSDCYKALKISRFVGVQVHSTGANNPYLRRYVQPDDGRLGLNTNGNRHNRPGVDVCANAYIGKLMDGTVEDLRRMAGAKRVLKATVGAGEVTLPEGAALISREGRRIEVAFDPEALPADRLVLHLAGTAGLTDMQVVSAPLDETVAALYRRMAEVEA